MELSHGNIQFTLLWVYSMVATFALIHTDQLRLRERDRREELEQQLGVSLSSSASEAHSKRSQSRVVSLVRRILGRSSSRETYSKGSDSTEEGTDEV